VTDLIIHPNQGELISCDQNGSIKIWDLSNNSCTHELVLLFLSWSGKRTGNPTEREHLVKVPQEDIPMRAVAIASDASLLAAANDNGRVFIWRMFVNSEGRLDLMPLAKIDAHSPKYILRLSISPDITKLATCGADGTTKIWEVDARSTKWALARTLEGHTRWVWDCVWSADSAYIVTGINHFLRSESRRCTTNRLLLIGLMKSNHDHSIFGLHRSPMGLEFRSMPATVYWTPEVSCLCCHERYLLNETCKTFVTLLPGSLRLTKNAM
jgi:WD40 repeat protein